MIAIRDLWNIYGIPVHFQCGINFMHYFDICYKHILHCTDNTFRICVLSTRFV